MGTVFIEPIPKDCGKGAPIQYYTVETRAHEKLKTFDTQEDAVLWARKEGHTIYVARVRETNKATPDHWRKV
jgi:hypothetical protein